MRRRVGLLVAALGLSLGVGMVGGTAWRVSNSPVGDVPVVCVMAAAADDGVPVPAPHAWERRCS
jgi:hypothetical protein